MSDPIELWTPDFQEGAKRVWMITGSIAPSAERYVYYTLVDDRTGQVVSSGLVKPGSFPGGVYRTRREALLDVVEQLERYLLRVDEVYEEKLRERERIKIMVERIKNELSQQSESTGNSHG